MLPGMTYVRDISGGWGSFNGTILRVARETLHMTQQELGLTIGVSGSTISVWENSERTLGSPLPNSEQLRKLCLVLKTDPKDFLYLSCVPEVNVITSNTSGPQS
jgi:transcriptional regulator with XRE-family HTH domain